MINNPILFYISAFLIIFFAVLSLCLKDLIKALLSAILVFFSAAVFFYILGSEYNAIIQAAIYGLAVPVIIGVSIMFTTGKKEPQKESVIPVITLIASGILLLGFIYVMMISFAILPDSLHIVELSQINQFDVISAFAKGIFINYVWAFELISLLLTIVIAGFTLFKKGRFE